MTRKELMDKEAFRLYPTFVQDREIFRRGFEYADNNPNHEVFNTRLKLEKKQWLEKVVKWLTENAFRYVVTRTCNEVKVTGLHTLMVEDFEKYMEDK